MGRPIAALDELNPPHQSVFGLNSYERACTHHADQARADQRLR